MKAPLEKVADNLPPPTRPAPLTSADEQSSGYSGLGTRWTAWERLQARGRCPVDQISSATGVGWVQCLSSDVGFWVRVTAKGRHRHGGGHGKATSWDAMPASGGSPVRDFIWHDMHINPAGSPRLVSLQWVAGFCQHIT